MELNLGPPEGKSNDLLTTCKYKALSLLWNILPKTDTKLLFFPLFFCDKVEALFA